MAAECATDPVENPLWWFVQEFYQREGVESALLDLQDRWGADVLLLLAACWLGTEGFEWPLDDEAFQDGLSNYTGWRDHIVAPLRDMRRTLPKGGDQGFRSKLKALELESEQLGLAGLFSLLTSVETDRWQVDKDLLEDNLLAVFSSDIALSAEDDADGGLESGLESVLASDSVEVILSQLTLYHQKKEG